MARPDDLDQHRLIAVRYLHGQVSRWPLRPAPGRAAEDRMPEPAGLVVSDPAAAVEAAVAGMGIAQGALHHTWPYLRAGKLKIVLPRHYDVGKRTMALQYPHRALVAPRVKATVAYLLDNLKANPALQRTAADLRDFAA